MEFSIDFMTKFFLNILSNAENKKFLVVLLLFRFCPYFTYSQGYIEYHRIINRINIDVIENSLDNASARFDSIIERFDFIYAKHTFQALQIECTRNDSIRITKWLQKCYLQGITKWRIQNNEYIRLSAGFKHVIESVVNSDSLNNIYLNSRNDSLNKVIDSLFEIDQSITRKLNNGFFLFRPFYALAWRKNNFLQYNVIIELTKSYGYPGDRLLSSLWGKEDSSEYKKLSFYGPFPGHNKTFFMMLHSCSHRKLNLNDSILWVNLEKGNISPLDLACILDFRAIWGKNDGRGVYMAWYTEIKDESEKNSEKNIDFRRNEIGLRSLKDQNRILDVYYEKRRRNELNNMIILDI